MLDTGFRRRQAGCPREQFMVKGGVGATGRIAAFQMLQFYLKDGALDAVHARVPTDDRVVVFFGLPMIAKDADFGGEGVVVGRDGASFAEGSKVFAGVKAEATCDS